jgi:hypothetical protein
MGKGNVKFKTEMNSGGYKETPDPERGVWMSSLVLSIFYFQAVLCIIL